MTAPGPCLNAAARIAGWKVAFCECPDCKDTKQASHSYKLANARLIAAAPDLLAALQFLTEQMSYWLDGVENPDQADIDAITDARAAIAKARGNQGE